MTATAELPATTGTAVSGAATREATAPETMGASTVTGLLGRDRWAPAVTSAATLTAGGAGRSLPVARELWPLLPGLRRGSTVAVAAGVRSLVLALLADASAAGCWAAVVGMPGLNGAAAAQAGVVLERLALVPHPGPEWPAVTAALLDGIDVVVLAPPAPVPHRTASRLAARARQRGAVLLPYGAWPGADLILAAERGVWEGLGAGRGRLRCRELTVVAQGRGTGGQERRVRVRLPDPAGRLAPGPARSPAARPAPGLRGGCPPLRLIPGAAVTGGAPSRATALRATASRPTPVREPRAA